MKPPIRIEVRSGGLDAGGAPYVTLQVIVGVPQTRPGYVCMDSIVSNPLTREQLLDFKTSFDAQVLFAELYFDRLQGGGS